MKITRQESAHPKRVPVSGNRNVLTVRGLDQDRYVPRFVNDREDRIARFLEAGYQFVNRDKNGIVSVGDPTAGNSNSVDNRVTKRVGGGVVAYLMAIPREFYEEDQKAKQAEIDDLESGIRRPNQSNRAISEEVDYGNVSLNSKLGGREEREPTYSKFKREPTT